MAKWLFLALALPLWVASGLSPPSSVRPLIEWEYVEWDKDDATFQQQYLATGSYASNWPVGIRAHPADANTFFISVPRFNKSAIIPATIAKVTNKMSTRTGRPLLTAWPSYDLNDPDRGTAGMRSCLGFTIDPYARMWVLDNGRVGDVGGTPQVWVFDVNTGAVMRRRPLHATVASPDTSFLNDLAVDTSRMVAYITDSSDPVHGADGGLIVYDYLADTVRRVLSAVVPTTPAPGVVISINRKHPFPGARAGADGITLSPDGKVVFFNPLTAVTLYAVPTSVLRDESLNQSQVAQHVTAVCDKGFTSDGIMMTGQGDLLLGSLDDSAVFTTNYSMSAQGVVSVHKPLSRVVQNSTGMTWPDTLAVDNLAGVFLFVSNGPLHFPPMDFNAVNFRVWRVAFPTPVHNFMYGMTNGLAGHHSSGTPIYKSWVLYLGIVLAIALIAGVGYWWHRRQSHYSTNSSALLEDVETSGDYARI